MKTFPVCRDMDWGRPIHVPAHVVEFKFDRCVVQQDKKQVTLTQTASHGMTGQQVCIPDSNSAKALSDSRSAGDPLKYLATLEYNCLYPWSLSLET